MNDKVVEMKKKSRGSLLIYLVVIIVVLLGILYLVLGQARIRQIVVTGSQHYTNEEIQSMVGITDQSTVLDVFFSKRSTYDYLPYIKKVSIHYLNFNSVQIDVEEKVIISYLPFQNRFLALDKDGYVVGYESKKQQDLPSITGLYLDTASIGEPLDVPEGVLAAMLNLYQLCRKYNINSSIIDFPLGDATMIHLYSGGLRMLLGDGSQLERKVKDGAEVLKKFDSSQNGTLDLQVDSDYYIFKKDSGEEIYFAYGERYISVDKDYRVLRVGPHKMKNQLIINGLTVEKPVEGAKVGLDGLTIDSINLIRQASESSGITLNEIDFINGHIDDVKLMSQQIILKIGSLEKINEKLSVAKKLIDQLEEGVKGTINLTKEKEKYSFEPSEEN